VSIARAELGGLACGDQALFRGAGFPPSASSIGNRQKAPAGASQKRTVPAFQTQSRIPAHKILTPYLRIQK